MQDAEDDQAGGGRAPRARAVPPITPDERRRRRGHKRLPVLRTRGLPAVPRSSQRHPVRPHATLTSNPPALRGTCCSCATNFQHVMVFVHPPRRHTQACRTVPDFRELRVRQSMFRDVPPVPGASQCPPATPAAEQHGRCGRVRLSARMPLHADTSSPPIAPLRGALRRAYRTTAGCCRGRPRTTCSRRSTSRCSSVRVASSRASAACWVRCCVLDAPHPPQFVPCLRSTLPRFSPPSVTGRSV